MRYRMKEAMELTGLGEKAIRLYMEKGLVKPLTEEQAGRRNYYFEENQIRQLRQVALLRFLGFRLQEIRGILYGGKRELQTALADYGERAEKGQLIAAVWETAGMKPADACRKVTDGGRLLEVLEEAVRKAKFEKLFAPDFGRLDQQEDAEDGNDGESKRPMQSMPGGETVGNGKRRFCLWAVSVAAGIFIMLAGTGIFSVKLAERKLALQAEVASFRYQVTETRLTADKIVWQSFPGWRTVSMEISGELTAQVPKGAKLELRDLCDRECMQEISRKGMVLSDGQVLLEYDEVVYRLENAFVQGQILRQQNTDAYEVGEYWGQVALQTGGYGAYLVEVEFVGRQSGTEACREETYILGTVPSGSEQVDWWSQEQNLYAAVDLTPYLSAYRLSRTYADIETWEKIEKADGVFLKRALDDAIYGVPTGDMLSFCITNESEQEWQYEAGLPAVEMWYQGVWLEVCLPYADPLMTAVVTDGTQEEVHISEKTAENCPYLIPGVYRLVVYGTDGDYICD